MFGRKLPCVWVVVVAICLRAMGAEEAKPPAAVPGWGVAVDHVGDSKVSLEEGTLTITVPGAYRDLWPRKGEVNAPLVLQDVEGDFTAVVKVVSVERAERDSVISGLASSVSFHAGTFVLWQDPENFVRLDRTNMNKAGRAITSCYLHVFKDGTRTVELAPLVADRPTHLRFERRGERLTVAYSQDGGKTWQPFPAQNISWPEKVQVGVAALNNTNLPCSIQFAELEVRRSEDAP